MAAASLLLAPLAACSPEAQRPGAPAANPTTATTPPRSVARIEVTPAADARRVDPNTPVSVRAFGGRLTDVQVRPSTGGPPLPGALSDDGTLWTAQPTVLELRTAYTVTAQAVDESGQGKVVQSQFTTVTPTAELKSVVTPGDGQLVGVGMPIMVQFTAPVTDRAAVERRLSVTTSPKVTGAWAWFGDQEVHWRPQKLWPTGTAVTLRMPLAGANAGKGVWGVTNRVIRFKVGKATVSTVDIANHTMTVTQDGQVLRTIPVTTGKSGYDTRVGTKVIISKERKVVMDSRTVDIPADSPDAYRLTVEYALRLTWSGEFLHAAPWSVASQGRANVSHGCTGMSMDNARWLYGLSKPGDVVRYVNGWRQLEGGNGYTDWNIPWSDWLTRSAL